METISNRQLARLLDAVCDDTFAQRIEVLEEAGRGGMGIVFRARLRADGTPIAIKELSPRDHVDLERFLKEADALERLDHAGIVRYREHGAMHDGRHYLAIDWLDGESLRTRLERGALGVVEAVDLARQIAEALCHAHDHGIVHRDLKPGNLMLVGTRVILVDFGIARRVDAEHATLTRTGQILGTPGYFSPEQLTAGAVIDGRTDVFALGCVVHEMLTGERAFAGDDVVQLIVEAMTGEPRVVPDVPVRLSSLVTAMLSKRPLDRPSAREAADELAAMHAALTSGDEHALATTSPLARTVQAAAPRNARRTGIVLALVTVGVGIVAWRATTRSAVDVVPPVAASAELPPCDRDRREGCVARCDQGDAEACLALGESLVHGTHGFARDRAAGLTHLRGACTAGVARACLTASTILRLESSAAPRERWGPDFEALLVRGCELDLGNACRRLATQLYDGGVLDKDEARAVTVGDKACKLGDNYACRAVATWHAEAGRSDAQREALQRACDRHDEIACKAL